MKTRLLLCCLMLGLSFLNYGSEFSSELASTAPTSPWSRREGTYSLIGGTDDCPPSMTWINQCGGFVLNPHNNNQDLEPLRFCQINKGVKINRNDFGEVKVQITQNEQYIKKLEKSFFSERTEIVFLDEGRTKFEWNQSENGKGSSCLYSR